MFEMMNTIKAMGMGIGRITEVERCSRRKLNTKEEKIKTSKNDGVEKAS